MIDQSSESRFSTGVPVSATLNPALSSLTARACCVSEFLTFWASSSTTPCHSTDFQFIEIASHERVSADDDVVSLRRLNKASPLTIRLHGVAWP